MVEGTIQRVCKGGWVLTYIWVSSKEALCSYYIWIILKVYVAWGKGGQRSWWGVVWGEAAPASWVGSCSACTVVKEVLTDTGLEQAEYLQPDRNNVDG